jgi:hypothetical protein
VYDRPTSPHKNDLIDWALRFYEIKSLVDLGACWGVNGGYTFHALNTHELERALIVDGDITNLTRERAAKFPQLELIAGLLGDADTLERIGNVDAAIIYDILLHQVGPNWDEFLEMYSHIDTLIIFNQSWLGPETVRFVEFGLDDYLKRVPHTSEVRVREWFGKHDVFHPDLRKPWRDVHYFWQWGITQKDLIDALWRLGYGVGYLASYGFYDPTFPEVELVGVICHKRGEPARLTPGTAFNLNGIRRPESAKPASKLRAVGAGVSRVRKRAARR